MCIRDRAKAALAAPVVRVALTGMGDPIGELTGTELPSLQGDTVAATKEKAVEIAARDPATAAVVLRKWLGAGGASPSARP